MCIRLYNFSIISLCESPGSQTEGKTVCWVFAECLLRAWHTPSHLILVTAPRDRHDHLHVTDEESEAQDHITSERKDQ